MGCGCKNKQNQQNTDNTVSSKNNKSLQEIVKGTIEKYYKKNKK